MYEGKNYEITILPKVGYSYKTNYAVTIPYSVPKQSQQISPVAFNGYTGASATVKSLVNAININNSNPSAEAESTIHEYIAKIYVNEGVIASQEMLNNPDKTNQLFEDVKTRITGKVIGIYSPNDALITEILTDLNTVYQETW